MYSFNIQINVYERSYAGQNRWRRLSYFTAAGLLQQQQQQLLLLPPPVMQQVMKI
jgi:hypothetical protein